MTLFNNLVEYQLRWIQNINLKCKQLPQIQLFNIDELFMNMIIYCPENK